MVWLKKESRVLLAVLMIVLFLISATACSAKNETVKEEEYQTADDVEMAQPVLTGEDPVFVGVFGAVIVSDVKSQAENRTFQ